MRRVAPRGLDATGGPPLLFCQAESRSREFNRFKRSGACGSPEEATESHATSECGVSLV